MIPLVLSPFVLLEWRMVYWEMPLKVCMWKRREGEKTEEESLVENNDNIDGMWSCM